MQRAWLIDASIYIFRAWFSLPDRWHTEDGMPLNALYGYVGFLVDFLTDTQMPVHCAAAFDESLGTCFRNDIYPGYKASRELPDEALAFQLDACRKATELLGIPSYSGERYEPDDYLASLARVCREQGMAVTVITRDKDLGQILSTENDHWWDFAGNVQLNPASFAEKHGVRPEQFGDFLALVGDSVDDIPGVPGVGAKTAAALLGAFGTLEEIEANLIEVSSLSIRGAKGLQNKLEQHWPQARLAQQLTHLEDKVPGIKEAPAYKPDSSNIDALVDYLNTLGLAGPLPRRCQKLAEAMKL